MLREVLARFGIDFDGSGIAAGIGGLKALAAAAVTTAVAFGVGFVVALQQATSATIELGVEVARTSEVLGLSTGAVQEWGFAASRAGLGVDEITDAMSTLQERARDAVIDPASDPAEQLRILGVAARDANGELKSGEQLFLEVSDGLAGMSNQTDRVGASMTLFGDVGRDLLPVLQLGSGGIAELRQRARDLGGVLDDDLIASTLAAVEAQADFDFAMRGVEATIARDVLPVMTAIIETTAELVGAFSNATRETRPLRAIMLGLAIAAGVLGAAIAASLFPLFVLSIPLIALFAAFAAGVALVVLVVDDLLTLFAGGDSIVGRFIDAMFGVGATKTVVASVREAFRDFVEFVVKNGIPAVMRVGRFLVGLWPLVRPGLRSFGKFVVGIFTFWDELPPRIQRAVKPITEFFEAIGAGAAAFFDGVTSRFAALRGQAAGVLGFLGIELNGAPASEARAPGAVASAAAKAPTTNVEQTVAVTINGTDLPAAELQSRIRTALSEANDRALRVAQRALTTVAPTPAGA